MTREQLIEHFARQFGGDLEAAARMADVVLAKQEELANPKPQAATPLQQPKPKRKTTSKPLAKTEKFHDIRHKLERGAGKLDRNLDRDPSVY